MFAPRLLLSATLGPESRIEDHEKLGEESLQVRLYLRTMRDQARAFLESGGRLTGTEWQALSVIEQQILAEQGIEMERQRAAQRALFGHAGPEACLEAADTDGALKAAYEGANATAAAGLEGVAGV